MTDLMLSEDFDLAVDGGDLVVGESTRQHQELLLLLAKGELRQYPLRGVGLRAYLLDDVTVGSINALVKREYEADGMRVRRISSLPSGALNVDAVYE